jgi:hypothetical protein
MGRLQDTYEAYQDKHFVVIGLNVADSETHAREFLEG